MRPLAIDLFCGLGGWTEGLLAEGYRVIGFDIERHRYRKVIRPASEEKLPGNATGAGNRMWSNRPIARLKDACDGLEVMDEWEEYPAQLVLQDVLTLDGRQFKDAALIVASPPCQGYSYRAMPWKRAKALPPPDNSLFEACFRIQQEASDSAGRHIPLVVENVKGAQKWVGRSRYHFGSFHLWGDVPALMPITMTRRMKSKISCAPYLWSDRIASTPEEAHAIHYKLPPSDGVKVGGSSRYLSRSGSKSPARKYASAMIAKIPLVLSRHIAASWKPDSERKLA